MKGEDLEMNATKRRQATFRKGNGLLSTLKRVKRGKTRSKNYSVGRKTPPKGKQRKAILGEVG